MKIKLVGLIVLAFSTSLFAKNDPNELLKYAAKDANVVSYFNFKDLTKSEFFKINGADLTAKFNSKADSAYLAFVEATGFKINEDVYELMVSASTDKKERGFVMAATGKFPEDKLLSYVRKKMKKENSDGKIEAVTVEGVSSYRLYDKGNDDKMMVSFVSENKIIAGHEDAVRTALSQSQSVMDNSEIMELIKGLKYKRQMFAVVNVDQMDANDKYMMRAKDLLNYMTVCADFDDELKMVVSSESTSEANAIEIEKLVNGMLALARLTVSDDRDFIDFMNEIDVSRDAKTIEISMEVNQERVEKLKRFLKRQDKIRIKRKS